MRTDRNSPQTEPLAVLVGGISLLRPFEGRMCRLMFFQRRRVLDYVRSLFVTRGTG